MTEAELEKKLWKKALKCGSMFSEAHLKVIIVEELRLSLRQSVRKWCSTNDIAYLGALQSYITSPTSLTNRTNPTKLPTRDICDQGRRGGRSAIVIQYVSTNTSSQTTTPILTEKEEEEHDLMVIMIIHGWT